MVGRLGRDEEAAGDVLCRQSPGGKPEHLDLPPCQAAGIPLPLAFERVRLAVAGSDLHGTARAWIEDAGGLEPLKLGGCIVRRERRAVGSLRREADVDLGGGEDRRAELLVAGP